MKTKPVEFEELEIVLQTRLAGKESPMISLHVDETVPMKEAVKVMNFAMDNNYKLILASRPK